MQLLVNQLKNLMNEESFINKGYEMYLNDCDISKDMFESWLNGSIPDSPEEIFYLSLLLGPPETVLSLIDENYLDKLSAYIESNDREGYSFNGLAETILPKILGGWWGNFRLKLQNIDQTQFYCIGKDYSKDYVPNDSNPPFDYLGYNREYLTFSTNNNKYLIVKKDQINEIEFIDEYDTPDNVDIYPDMRGLNLSALHLAHISVNYYEYEFSPSFLNKCDEVLKELIDESEDENLNEDNKEQFFNHMKIYYKDGSSKSYPIVSKTLHRLFSGLNHNTNYDDETNKFLLSAINVYGEAGSEGFIHINLQNIVMIELPLIKLIHSIFGLDTDYLFLNE